MHELEGRPLTVADLATGIVVALIGIFIVVASLGMPTFAERNANILTAPGIMPGAVGVMLALSGLRLTWRSVTRLRSAADEGGTRSAAPMAIAALGIGFLLMAAAVALVGRIDFKLLISAFALAFCAIFLPWHGTRREKLVRLAAAAFVVLLAGWLIPTGFERIFLVRLP